MHTHSRYWAFVHVNQLVDGHESIPIVFSAIVPTAEHQRVLALSVTTWFVAHRRHFLEAVHKLGALNLRQHRFSPGQPYCLTGMETSLEDKRQGG